MKPLIYLSVLIFLFAGYYESQAKDNGCRISRIIPETGESICFHYDSLGKLTTITEGDYITTFQYYGGTTIATETDKGATAYKRIMTFDSKGMLRSMLEEKQESNTAGWTYKSYMYKNTELSKIITVLSYWVKPVQTSFIWDDGNCVAETSDEIKKELNYGNHYDYYADKPVQEGGYWYINVLWNVGAGDAIYRNKNLLKSIRNHSGITDIHYEFDNSGRIITMTKISGNATKVWHYEYECDIAN